MHYFHTPVDRPVDNVRTYRQSLNVFYLVLGLSESNKIFTLWIVHKIERVSGIELFRLQPVEGM
jgi:hypothetical protein